MNEKVIVALDFENTRRALEFLELFYAGGSDFLRVLKEKGHRVFLDLKLHDIPNTVERTMRVLTRLGVDMVNLHAAGGKAMMEAAVRGLTRPDGTRPVLLAVTQLTSTDERTLREELLIPLRFSIPYFSMAAGSASTILLDAYGSSRLAVPTSTAQAPASIISRTSSALCTPPTPIMGIRTASYTR